MGIAVETVVGSYAAAATATAQPYTPGNGQTFQVRATQNNSYAWLTALWNQAQDAGYTRVRSPRLHDNVVGAEWEHYIGNTNPLANENFCQMLFSQDILTVEDFFTAAPTATHVQQVGFNVYYDDLGGANANYMTWAQVQPMIKHYMGFYVLPESNATVGQWGVGVELNSSQDQMKADSLYAVLGYITPTRFTAWALQGPDTSNYQYGGPGSIDPIVTRYWFCHQEKTTGKPSIPIINSQNKQATTIQVFDTVAATVYPISLLCAYLGPIGAAAA